MMWLMWLNYASFFPPTQLRNVTQECKLIKLNPSDGSKALWYLQIQLLGVTKVAPRQLLHCEAKKMQLSLKKKLIGRLRNLVASFISIQISISMNRTPPTPK